MIFQVLSSVKAAGDVARELENQLAHLWQHCKFRSGTQKYSRGRFSHDDLSTALYGGARDLLTLDL